MIKFIQDPWPWYFSGFMISIVLLALYLVGKKFGMSSNLRTICAAVGAGNKVEFFNYDWKSHRWNLIVVFGVLIGGFIATTYMSPEDDIILNANTIQSLEQLGINYQEGVYLPDELYSLENLQDIKVLLLLVLGGVLVGFGTRYAGGCTSGHAITGLSNFQLPSLIAVIGFFIGGLIMVHLVFPLIF